MKLEVIDAKAFHCGAIIRTMRVDHQRALMAMGVPMHREFRSMFDASYYRKAAFIDGKLAAVWGVEGTPMCTEGRIWLVLGQHTMKHPVTVMREARKQLEEIATTKTRLVTTVIGDDEASVRLAVALGFEAADGSAPGSRAHSREGRSQLVRYLRENPALLVAAGSAQQIGIVWQREAA